MPTPILATKLFVPPPRPEFVSRPRLIERLNEGLNHKLTLVSAAAGFGKTTLVSEWIASSKEPSAWLSLDEADSEPTRFLTYFVTALQTILPRVGTGILAVLHAPQPPPAEVLVTTLLNEIASVPHHFTLVLDDYHLLDSQPIDHALTFLIKHQPPHMHLVIITREDPQFPLSQLRARGQLTEVRVADLRFTHAEAADFLNHVMRLNLSAQDVAALETRTEGWIAGLQLAALSMQGSTDTARFIESFTGSHRFVLDYLAEEVFQKQSEQIQRFLLHTAILERMCAPLCDVVVDDLAIKGQDSLAYIERANIFIIPLDSERRWYRYHHLFADLLRQRLQQNMDAGAVAELHLRASMWYEANGFEIDAFQHAVAAHDFDRAAYLAEGGGMPLLFRGAAGSILHWLRSLPDVVLDTKPGLWVMYASAVLFAGQMSAIEDKLQAAERALQKPTLDEYERDMIGHIASIRATVAVALNQVDVIISQSRRALEYLHPNNLPVRTATTWTLGVAYQLRGDRAAARRAYTEAIRISQAIGHLIIDLMSTFGLGNMQEADNQLAEATATYQRVIDIAGQPPQPVASSGYIGLARISYEHNDLEAAQRYAEQAVHLVRQIEKTDQVVVCEVFLARVRLAQGDIAGAEAVLTRAEHFARQHFFAASRLPIVAGLQVVLLLMRGDVPAADEIASLYDLPLSQARVRLAGHNPAAALELLEPLYQQAVEKGWVDEQLKLRVIQAVALFELGEKSKAAQHLGEALRMGEPEGFVRTFIDEGLPMAKLLAEAVSRGVMPDYTTKLLAAMEAQPLPSPQLAPPPLIEPLSQRELEVLGLIAQGLSNHEIGERLFLTLNTVKGHNQRIFGKLQVERRTEAVARARELGLL